MVSFKTHRVNKDFSNSVKDALSEFRVIVVWYTAINHNSELGIFLQSMKLNTDELSLSPSDVKWFLEVNHLGPEKN